MKVTRLTQKTEILWQKSVLLAVLGPSIEFRNLWMCHHMYKLCVVLCEREISLEWTNKD